MSPDTYIKKKEDYIRTQEKDNRKWKNQYNNLNLNTYDSFD